MINKWKFAAAATLVAVSMASPALAQGPASGQGFSRVYGTGNVGPTYYDHDGGLHLGVASQQNPQQNRFAARRRGLNAFARVPDAAFGLRGPQAIAGGSIGYNKNLRTDQW
jgi:hypothetical protein